MSEDNTKEVQTAEYGIVWPDGTASAVAKDQATAARYHKDTVKELKNLDLPDAFLPVLSVRRVLTTVTVSDWAPVQVKL